MKAVCRACGGEVRPLGRAKVLRAHDVGYECCPHCDYIQTETPYWLEEAYKNPITAQDTGSLERVLTLADVTKVVLALVLGRRGRCLDYGGGYGVFTRRMRDLGVDFRWEDRYCENLLARGFEARPGEKGFVLATCFEVLEHVERPRELLAELLARADAVLVGTELNDGSRERFFEWPYVAAEHGQHVGFCGERTLRRLADSLGVRVVSNGKSLHLFHRGNVPRARARLALATRVSRVVAKLIRWDPLTRADHEFMRDAGTGAAK
jgi:hypothetical protein